jgi:hypothetical protein
MRRRRQDSIPASLFNSLGPNPAVSKMTGTLIPNWSLNDGNSGLVGLPPLLNPGPCCHIPSNVAFPTDPWNFRILDL